RGNALPVGRAVHRGRPEVPGAVPGASGSHRSRGGRDGHVGDRALHSGFREAILPITELPRELHSRAMRAWRWVLVAATIASPACDQSRADSDASRTMPPARVTEIEAGVRAFAQTVARDVTQQGPAAWRTHFGNDPARSAST